MVLAQLQHPLSPVFPGHEDAPRGLEGFGEDVSNLVLVLVCREAPVCREAADPTSRSHPQKGWEAADIPTSAGE